MGIFGRAYTTTKRRTCYTLRDSGDLFAPCTVTKQRPRDPFPVPVFSGGFGECAAFIRNARR